MTSRILVSLRVAASQERTFHVFVQDIGAWWRPNEIFSFAGRASGVLAFEPKLGGRLTETFSNGDVFEIGRITGWEPVERLAFTWRQASFSPEQSTEVEVRFQGVEDQTRVTVEHTGWDKIPLDHVARHRFPDAVFLQRHGEWWQGLLATLQKVAQSPPR